MNRRGRAAIADATLAAGATILLLDRSAVSLALGVACIVAGLALLWGTPRPDLTSRMLASVAGLLVGFGYVVGGTGRWVAALTGLVLLTSLLARLSRR